MCWLCWYEHSTPYIMSGEWSKKKGSLVHIWLYLNFSDQIEMWKDLPVKHLFLYEVLTYSKEQTFIASTEDSLLPVFSGSCLTVYKQSCQPTGTRDKVSWPELEGGGAGGKGVQGSCWVGKVRGEGIPKEGGRGREGVISRITGRMDNGPKTMQLWETMTCFHIQGPVHCPSHQLQSANCFILLFQSLQVGETVRYSEMRGVKRHFFLHQLGLSQIYFTQKSA